jgi:hypothetical protein
MWRVRRFVVFEPLNDCVYFNGFYNKLTKKSPFEPVHHFVAAPLYSGRRRGTDLPRPALGWWMAAMNRTSIVDNLTFALHCDPSIVSKVGDRVIQGGQSGPAILPDIVVNPVLGTRPSRVREVRITCRAKTSSEADVIGAAVVTALSDAFLRDTAWAKISDRSGYDHASRAFRRVIAIEPKRSSK